MKKTLLSTIVLLLPAIMFAQTKNNRDGSYSYSSNEIKVEQLVTCPDFTITTTDGVTRNLYATLDAGNAVMLDQFFTTCSYCIQYAPTVEQAYVANGSGSGHVQFWGIDAGNTNAQVATYKTTYGVGNPCASGTEGGGDAADAALQTAYPSFSGYPTYSVVCPNRTISFDVNYPPTANGFNSYFTGCGISAAPELEDLKFDNIYPSPASDFVNFEITIKESCEVGIEIYNLMGQKVISHSTQYGNGVFRVSIPLAEISNGTYIVKLTKNQKLAEVSRIVIAK